MRLNIKIASLTLIALISACEYEERPSYPLKMPLLRCGGRPESIILIPDTQNYTKNDKNNAWLKGMTTWIRDNARAYGIRAVLQAGDIVNNNKDHQWKRAIDAFSVLNGRVPYFLAAGNHDMGWQGFALTRDTERYRRHYRIDDSATSHAHGGSFNGETENSYFLLDIAGEDFMVLMLEFGPRDSVLAWANEVVAKHRGHKVILLTHEFMDEASRLQSSDGLPRRSSRSTFGNAHSYPLKVKRGEDRSKNNGSELWDKLVDRHPNFEMVLSGHYRDYDDAHRGHKLREADGAARAYRADKNRRGATVHQFMYDPQWVPSGGDGWMLLLEFGCDSGRSQRVASAKNFRVQSFSPILSEGRRRPTSKIGIVPDILALKRR